MKASWEFKELLDFLKEVRAKSYDFVSVCIDCKVVTVSHEHGVSWDDWVRYKLGHDHHHVIFSDCDHDGIGEWIKCLEWVLDLGSEEVKK